MQNKEIKILLKERDEAQTSWPNPFLHLSTLDEIFIPATHTAHSWPEPFYYSTLN